MSDSTRRGPRAQDDEFVRSQRAAEILEEVLAEELKEGGNRESTYVRRLLCEEIRNLIHQKQGDHEETADQ